MFTWLPGILLLVVLVLSVLRAGGIKELIDKWESTAAKRGSRALILRLMLIFSVALLSSMLVHLLRG